MREFSLALGLYSTEDMNNNLFAFYYASCVRNRPNNYNPSQYFWDISTNNHYDSINPFSYTTIKSPVRRLVHRLITLSVTGRYSSKEKVTLADLFYLHNMDGGELVDLPWHVARFLSDKAKGIQKKSKIKRAHLIRRIARHFRLMSTAALRLVTRGQETTLYDVVKFSELGIVRFNGLAQAEIVDEMLDGSDEEVDAVEARRAQEENEGSPR
ncbi:hypothetical protein Tco_0787910 [Tanacetum coccineum]